MMSDSNVKNTVHDIEENAVYKHINSDAVRLGSALIAMYHNPNILDFNLDNWELDKDPQDVGVVFHNPIHPTPKPDPKDDIISGKEYVNFNTGKVLVGHGLLDMEAGGVDVDWDEWKPLSDLAESYENEVLAADPVMYSKFDELEPNEVYVCIKTGAQRLGTELMQDGSVEYEEWTLRDDATTGKKFDNDKPDWSLAPADELEDIIKVFTMGAGKYGRENWKNVENGMFRYYAAAMRHLRKYKKYMETGDPNLMVDDDYPHMHHLAHAATNLIFLMWLDNNKAHNFNEKDMPAWWDQQMRAAMEDEGISDFGDICLPSEEKIVDLAAILPTPTVESVKEVLGTRTGNLPWKETVEKFNKENNFLDDGEPGFIKEPKDGG